MINLFCPDRTAVSEDEDDERLVQPASRKEPWKKSVNLPQNEEFLHKYEEEKDLQSGENHLPLGARCVKKLA